MTAGTFPSVGRKWLQNTDVECSWHWHTQIMIARAVTGQSLTTLVGLYTLAQAFSTATIRQMARSATVLPQQLVPILKRS